MAFFLKLLGLPPLYHLYVQIYSLTWLAPQESFAPKVIKILITSHIRICSWENSVFAICWMRESPMNTISDIHVPRNLLSAGWQNLLWTQSQTNLVICFLLDERISYEHNLRLTSVFASAGWENLWTQSQTQLGICYLLDETISYEHISDLMYLGICYLLDDRISNEHNLRLNWVFVICWMRESLMNIISDLSQYLLSAGWENLPWTQTQTYLSICYLLDERISYEHNFRLTSVFAVCWMRESPMNTISNLPQYLLSAGWENLLWTQSQVLSL